MKITGSRQCRLWVLTVIWSIFSASAHENDPKLLDRQPRYEGPGYRSDVAGRRGEPAFPSSGITLMAWLPLPEFGEVYRASDCWGYTSDSGREYAILGFMEGTAFVEITQPGNPQIVAVLEGFVSAWRDIKTYRHFAYASTEGGGGVQVFDLAQIDAGIVTLATTITEGGTLETHNVAIDEDSGFLYRCGGYNVTGLRIYSLADPANPEFVARWDDKYVHDAQIVTYTEGPYAGRQIAFACAGFNGGYVNPGLSIIDVTDKSDLRVLTHYEFPDPVYSHQGWLSEDKRLFYLNDELDERDLNIPTTTHVIDVSDLANPVQVSTFGSGSSAIDHNLYVRNGHIFEANYRSGLRVFNNEADARNPVEVAFFDTYPEDDQAKSNGLWSVYPFFPSGTIIGSDIERGLFVWRLTRCGSSYDVNEDCFVDLKDFGLVAAQWNHYCQGCAQDTDHNGRVTVQDMVSLLNNIP
ncbi:Choice-of-anchor B family protein [Sulfidibacter corallicola]|uniref:Choice-of-anchor B family protein n=1 Tax=Sulfidibacter corallicola TaxID=2818388 RepID=A0A8A4TWE6_SULCO|nr:choice-of-anchor B family protein [Sulfidibacter corallicola]QTD53677.1 choice-of-anchor B family protein [Sulfidibacter corallicola]